MIVDTDVLIWYMRGNTKARRALDKQGSFSISTITYMEIVQGVRNKKELQVLRQFIKARNIRCIPVDSDVSARGMFLLEEYALSHGMQMGDALIAATVENEGETLFAANTAHYKMIPNLSVKAFKP